MKSTSNKIASKSVLGWMEYVYEARSKSLFWHNIWIDVNVRALVEQIVKQHFADTSLANHNRL